MSKLDRWTQIVAIVWAILLVLSFIAVSLYSLSVPGPHLQYVSTGLLTAGAALAAGTLLGFLFGIPRRVSSGQTRMSRELRDTSETPGGEAEKSWFSTNLAEVSDWLTKLLLGAGLVGLTQLGPPARSLINAVARGLRSPTNPDADVGASLVTAGAILSLFSILGFTVGYALTTLWYRRVVEEEEEEKPPPNPPAERLNDGAIQQPPVAPPTRDQPRTPAVSSSQ